MSTGTETAEAKITREIKEIKTSILEAVKAKADLETVREMQSQLDALDKKLAERHAGITPQDGLKELLTKDEGVQRLLRDRKGSCYLQIPRAAIEQKTTIDRAAAGFATSGVLQIDRTSGIVTEARQSLTMRQLLSSRPTALGMIDFVKVNSAQAAASMQTESSAKVENALTFTTASQKVETIATWIPASRQVLDDMAELSSAIDSALRYAVRQREDIEILFGNGNSPDLNGLYTQATAFDTSLLSLTPGWNKSDMLSCGIQQIQIAKETEPTFVVLHPTDMWQIRRTKNANRDYVFGVTGAVDPFWGLVPYPTTHMSSGQFLIGSGSPEACEIRDRMQLEVTVSTEHSDYYVKNLVAIRAESRCALVTYRPASFIKGTFSASPA